MDAKWFSSSKFTCLASSRKIYQVTKDFIQAYWILKEKGELPKHERLCEIMGIRNVSSLSEILAQRQNIQPGQWQKFKNFLDITNNAPKGKYNPGKVDEQTLADTLERMVTSLNLMIELQKKILAKL